MWGRGKNDVSWVDLFPIRPFPKANKVSLVKNGGWRGSSQPDIYWRPVTAFFFFFFSVPECCQNAINRTLGKLGAIVHTFYCPTINKNCEKQWHEKILKISYTHTRTHTQTQIKSPPWTRDTRGSFGGNLDYREKPTRVPGWLIHWSELINKLFN